MPKYVNRDLAEVIFFLKDRDFSGFIFKCGGDKKFAVTYTNEVGELLISNVSDNVIPEEKGSRRFCDRIRNQRKHNQCKFRVLSFDLFRKVCLRGYACVCD